MEKYINQIIHADCMDILKQLPDKCIDAIICDLPYGTTACSWDSIIPFDKLWEQYKRIRKDNTPIVLFGSEPFSTYLRMSNIKEYKYDWYYLKERGTGFANSNKQPMRRIENVCVFYKEQPYYNSEGEKLIKPYKHALPIYLSDSDRVQGSNNGDINNRKYAYYEYSKKHNVLEFSRKTKDGEHPTQKPIKLLEYLINTYSNEGDLILDNCSGSGSLAVACHNLKRRFICIEKDYDYWKASVERLKNAQAQQRLNLEF